MEALEKVNIEDLMAGGRNKRRKKKTRKRKRKSRNKKGGTDPVEVFMSQYNAKIDAQNARTKNEDGSNSYYFPKMNKDEGFCTPKYVFKNQICNAGNRKETFNNRGDIGRRDDYNHYLPCYRSKCSSSGRADKMGVCLSGADARQDEMAKSGVAGVGDILSETKRFAKGWT